MAIRFHCPRCNQLLGIASRKAGTEIECPKCRLPQTVPSEEAAAAAMAMTSNGQGVEDMLEDDWSIDYDDQPAAILGPPRHAFEDESLHAPPPAPPPSEDGRPMPTGMILFRRRTVYLQAVLFLAFAAGAFAVGYLIGRGDASLQLQNAYEEAIRQDVLVDGMVYYDTGAGTVAGDEGAVVIVLPHDKYPEATLPIKGIRPQDPAPDADNESIRLIDELGGIHTRADGSGAFTIVLPGEGKYHLLIISRHTTRAEGAAVDELELDEMTRYFFRADDLINRYKYRWTLEEIRVGGPAIEQNFGRDEQP